MQLMVVGLPANGQETNMEPARTGWKAANWDVYRQTSCCLCVMNIWRKEQIPWKDKMRGKSNQSNNVLHKSGNWEILIWTIWWHQRSCLFSFLSCSSTWFGWIRELRSSTPVPPHPDMSMPKGWQHSCRSPSQPEHCFMGVCVDAPFRNRQRDWR